ncbi:serine hydrolase domain-containing protein [Streptomyces sp. NPDC096324]|uniref:serine hydrolase domain-containing protein n=1 Tax=Streptomyces sp. NPDC096324 TaxID=3366085 RepID=UPI003814F66D
MRKLSPAVTAQLDHAIKDVLKTTKTPGVTVGLWAPGKGSYVRAFGTADEATNAPMSPRFNMRVGSVTKTFTVTALLRLVDQKKVGLDDPVSKYVRGVPEGDRITLRHLAQMRSGLFNFTEDPDFGRPSWPIRTGPSPPPNYCPTPSGIRSPSSPAARSSAATPTAIGWREAGTWCW